MKSACTRRDGDIKPLFSSIFTQKCVGLTRLPKIGKIYLIRTADRRDRRHIVKCGALDSREPWHKYNAYDIEQAVASTIDFT